MEGWWQEASSGRTVSPVYSNVGREEEWQGGGGWEGEGGGRGVGIGGGGRVGVGREEDPIEI